MFKTKKVNLAVLFVLCLFTMGYGQRTKKEYLPKVPMIVANAAKLEGFRAIHCSVVDRNGKTVRLFTDATEENIYMPVIVGCSVMFMKLDANVDF